MLRTGLAAVLLACLPAVHAQEIVTITLPDHAASAPIQGRLLLLISPNDETEPRFQVRAGPRAIQVFGQDVTGWVPGSRQLVDPYPDGYPLSAWSELEAGTYTVQAVLNRYEAFELATGHTVSLPPDQGEGQQWNRKPGNLYSAPQTLRLDPAEPGTLELALDQEIPPIVPPEDTEYIKHITIQSELLTEFWGRPMFLGAHVLLPHGFEEHPEARYPLMIFHGHFPDDFGGFRPEPPDTTEPCVPSERFGEPCYNRIVQQEAHDVYQTWTSDDFPRFLAIEIQHPTPYYDDSYAVNSASQGPYGDAIMHELVPAIEAQFRGLGEGWARFTYGGSTGGWEALAAQVFYPDDLNGAFAACPDPIDFRAYELINLYEDANAYLTPGPFRQLERPARRDSMGTVYYTVRDENHMERALGSKGRSGGQWDIWQATYSPIGADGYPQPIFDKRTGEIDPDVAAYWRENYDLRHILQRDWATLGPKLEGKIHIYVGDMDNYYLNNAVYMMEDFLESTTDPYYAGEVAYGDRDEHCWNGDPALPNAISRLRYNTMYVPRILERIRESAPAGADTTSWRH
ncbi:MAG: alpha/beta hydrolase-fold protein [Rubricoccaceae bacterium]